MSGILLDTNVISESARPEPDAKVLTFLASKEDLWLSVVVIHELEYGVRVLPPGRRRDRIAVAVRSLVAQ
ncbi:PIN domain-containing protein [Candidatus Poriferisocius sp.]|uniref:PIN domain-containing protein n=1 Tax=Candidatus Poriferisocius sp. TaxID=3101276 RepID=UPI003B016E3F